MAVYVEAGDGAAGDISVEGTFHSDGSWMMDDGMAALVLADMTNTSAVLGVDADPVAIHTPVVFNHYRLKADGSAGNTFTAYFVFLD
jgi:hypothetical protein